MMKIITKVVSGLDRRLRKVRGQPAKKYDQFSEIQKKFFNKKDQLIIFDVGAHIGESIDRFRTVFPHAVIHSFEADQENYQTLCKKVAGQAGLFLNNFGVGSQEGWAKFFRNLKSDTSSFNPLNAGSAWLKTRSRQYNVSEKDFTQKSYDIPIRTLDSYIEKNGIEHINILKIDTQGYEDEVLKGAKKAIKNGVIDMIETELIVGDLYQKSLSFRDIEELLLPYGYKFYAISNSGDLLHQPSLAFNLIYIRAALLHESFTLKAA